MIDCRPTTGLQAQVQDLPINILAVGAEVDQQNDEKTYPKPSCIFQMPRLDFQELSNILLFEAINSFINF